MYKLPKGGFFNGMTKVKLTEFRFVGAKYRLVDKAGNKAFMIMDYKNNAFKIKAISNTDDSFRDVISGIAEKLLEKKSGKNFARKINRRIS